MSQEFDIARCEEIMSRHLEQHNLALLYDISDEVKRYEDLGDAEQVAMWSAVYKAFSLGFSKEDREVKLVPGTCWGGWSSASVESFNGEEYLLFAKIAGEAKDYRLKARMADILWSARECVAQKVDACAGGGLPAPCHEYARMAAAAYSAAPLSCKSWCGGARAYYYRLGKLLRTVCRQEAELLSELEERVLQAMEESSGQPIFVCELSRYALCFRSFSRWYSRVLVALKNAAEAAGTGKMYEASLCYSECKKWCKVEREQARFDKLAIEAELKHTGYNETLRKVLCMNGAIRRLISYEKQIREELGLDEMIRKFTLEIERMRPQMLSEMEQIRYDAEVPQRPIDTSFDGVVSFIAAMEKLADLLPFTDENEVETRAAAVPQSLVEFCCKVVEIGDNGNIAAPNAHPAQLGKKRAYRLFIAEQAYSTILPAVDYIREHYGIDQEGLKSYISSVSPIGEERSFLHAMGVNRGVEGAFYEGVLQLVFQLEQTLRNLLCEHGGGVMRQNADGSQEEKGLPTLLKCERLGSLLPGGALYDLNELFGDNLNIRNRMAHGLVKDDEVNSAYIIYAWWYLWKLIVELKRS